MSWADLLHDASFRGVTFECERTHDSAKRALAEHEYPYLDGANVEDLGRRARRTSLTAVFWGDDYETRLQAFLQALDTPGSGELIHPVFGSMPNMQLDDYELSHDADNPDHCRIELRFVESTSGNPFFAQQLPDQKAEAVSALADAARANGIAAFGMALDALKSVRGILSRLNNLRDVMTGTLGAIRSQVQGIIGTTLDIIEYPQAFASDIVSYLSGMADLRSFDVGVITSDWKGLTGQLANTVQLPASISAGTATVASSAGMVPTGVTYTTNGSSSVSAGTSGSPSTSGGTSGSGGSSTSSGAASSSGTSATVMPAAVVAINANPTDIATVRAIIQLAAAAQLADAASSILADEAASPTLSPAEIERIVDDTRTSIQAAIDLHRQVYTLDTSRPIVEGLKDMALAVQTAAIAVMDARPPLITRTITAAGNLHLVAFRWYGDYTRASELLLLNPQIINPNFLQPGDVLNAYSQ
ncbi:Mu-like prophage DNA circulation protein [Burkholderia vietnamiensis]|nr:prophage DNA circulation protein [Burkholderia vietnamiensis]SCZ28149.1 Mu-like prophage DNA circulation protein [Burkholderia vietnamiensis]SFX63010.1 Mu-like prophage DNA circulation protein [Burkholderia vietnamiensis]